MSRTSRMLSIAAAAIVSAATLPAVARAATVTITGDLGQAIPLDPTATIRNMDTRVVTTLQSGETSYKTTIIGPGGSTADESNCALSSDRPTDTRDPRYLGNGAYTLTVDTFGGAGCSGARTSQTFMYAVNAGVAIRPPEGAVLYRAPGGSGAIQHRPAFTTNPGADHAAYEVRFAKGVPVQRDGGLGPTAVAGSVNATDPANAFAMLSFPDPGTYLVVARAQKDGNFSPWSAPLTVRVIAPFDLVATPTFPDARGPRYRVRGRVREDSATGRVTVALARGRRGGRFRTIARSRIRHNGVFSASFTIRRRGVYRLRYSYRGNATVARGSATQQIRISTVRF